MKDYNNTSSDKIVTPYGDKGLTKKEEVALMFDAIAPRYDFMNHLLSMGIDKGWRKKAVSELKNYPVSHLLDIATGTGDLAIEALSLNPLKITGIDISRGMLASGRKKIVEKGLTNKIELLYADSENIPFNDNTFDAAIVGFGVRSFENLTKGLKEIYRVLKPGSKFVVLEFSHPGTFPVKQIYGLYFSYLLPAIGKIFSKDKSAYTYLPKSVNAFPDGKEFLLKLENSGFKNTSLKELTFGIATIYTGIK